MVSSEPERFWPKVNKTDSCWLWTAAIIRTNGYGSFTVKRDGKWHKILAHRWAYENIVGPVPDGLDLDHLCRVRHCCNPKHLEAVFRRENLIRGETIIAKQVRQTECKWGHSLADAYVRKNNKRQCRQCAKRYNRPKVKVGQ